MICIKKIFFVLLFISSVKLFPQSQIFYVDPNTGNDSNTGTIDQPFLTISKGITALGSDIGTLYLRAGIYNINTKLSLNKNGQVNNYIKIWAYLNEKPILDFKGIQTNTDGFSVSGTYYYIKGLEIKNATHNGINISGHYNIIENCSVHDNGNTGIHMGSSSSTANPSNNLILNCDSYFNFDSPTGGNADGFCAKWNVGTGNVFRGCRSWNNSDDGWDLWMCSSTIIIDSCFSYRNGVDSWHTGQVSGNGNGIKLGGSYVATQHIVKNCVAFDNAGNSGKGFDENHNTAGQVIYNCTSFRNKANNFNFTDNLVQGNHSISNCISFQGNVAITNGTLHNNSWQGFTISASDFLSTDTTGINTARNTDGTLQKINFLRLSSISSMINAGVDVGIPFTGTAPDLGAFEFDPTIPSAVEKIGNIPSDFILLHNYPNPFNPETTIEFQIPRGGNVSIKIFDVNGRQITELYNGFNSAGSYKVRWLGVNDEGLKVAAGIYFCIAKFENSIKSNKLLLLK